MNIVKAEQVIRVIEEHFIEGEFVIEVDCEDYQIYKSLPSAVKHYSGRLIKTGWNSDRFRAYFKTEMVGQVVDLYA